jgi:PIN domain nuclease of toxin-antitoxin system
VGISCLIDTHILLWWVFDDPQLSPECREIIRSPENRILVSSASAWEIATKYRIGKLPEAKVLVAQYESVLQQAAFIDLPVTTAHALLAGNLPIEHRDPFDRMIMAQGELENLPVMTYDATFHTGRIQVIPTRP